MFREEVISDRRLSKRREYNGATERHRERGDEHTYPHVCRQTVFIWGLKKKKVPPFFSRSLLIEIMYHDCSLICFQWLARASESLFYIRVRPRGSKQRQPVVMHSSSPLISCVVGRVSLIPPDSCHSPSQCTIVDSDTHRLPHQNNCRSGAHALSHLREIASVKYIMLVPRAGNSKDVFTPVPWFR